MSRIGAQRSSAATAFLSVAAAVIPLVAGVALTLSLADDSLRNENLRVGMQAVEQVDRLLTAAANTTSALVPMTGKRCETVLPMIRREVARNPWLRSAELTYRGMPYCSSVSGKLSSLPPATLRAAGPFTEARLEFRAPDALSQDFGSLLLTSAGEDFGITVTLDNQLLVDRLDLVSGTTDVALNLNGMYLWDDGSLLRGELRQNPRYRASIPSTAFNYAMHSSVSAEDVLTLLMGKLTTILGTLAMVSIFTGGLCHWLLSRPRPVKRGENSSEGA